MASNKVDEQDPLAPIYEVFSSGEDDENDPSAMSLVDHLEELRWRIFKSLIAIAVGSVVAFIFLPLTFVTGFRRPVCGRL